MKNNKRNPKKLDEILKENDLFLAYKKKLTSVGGRRSDVSVNKQHAANG
jgi:hypothetical protein